MRPMEQKIAMVEYLKPIKDRILCAVSGNHEARSGKDADDNPMYDIMAKLDLEDYYRENAAFIKVSCGERSSGKANSAYTFCVIHGTGGGSAGSVVNRNEKFGYNIEGLDCLIVGHSHKGTVSKPSKIVIDPYNNIVSIKDYVVISSISWLNYGGYALRKMLSPAQTANPQRLILSGSKKKNIEVRW